MSFGSGDVVLVDLGATPRGREQAGVRPAIFVSAEGGVAILIPLSSNPERLRFKATVKIAPNRSNKLSKLSVALVFQLRALDFGRIVHRIGTLSGEQKRAVNVTLRSVALIK